MLNETLSSWRREQLLASVENRTLVRQQSNQQPRCCTDKGTSASQNSEDVYIEISGGAFFSRSGLHYEQYVSINRGSPFVSLELTNTRTLVVLSAVA
jgi:hypothetical protein